jgi:hypothetical protein
MASPHETERSPYETEGVRQAVTTERRLNSEATVATKLWEPMKLTFVGNLNSVMRVKPGSRGDGGGTKRQ